jgi:hypothetical protein
MSAAGASGAGVTESGVPSRTDRIPWRRLHCMIVFALGITWVLTGLKVQLAGNAGPGGRLPRREGRPTRVRLVERRAYDFPWRDLRR